MNRLFVAMVSAMTALHANLAFANVSEGPADYSGITGIYYTLIGLILAYGMYDTFFKKS